jgi:hypothetical protein
MAFGGESIPNSHKEKGKGQPMGERGGEVDEWPLIGMAKRGAGLWMGAGESEAAVTTATTTTTTTRTRTTTIAEARASRVATWASSITHADF